jgi:tripartite ATP-independent transporter DctP family solute receptor
MGRICNLLVAIVLVGTFAAALGYFSSTQSRAGNVIRIGHDSKENSPLHKAMLSFEQLVEANSNGNIRVEIYPARQLGDVRETTELVRQGNLQMTTGASVLLTSIVPEFNVLDMFYLFDDASHAHRSLDSDAVGGALLAAMQSKGFHGLGYMEVGFRSITSNRRAIQSVSDLQGLKIRAASNPAQIEAWKAVGTAPTPLSWGEIFTSLQQGLINTQESAIYSIYAERFYEAQRYLSITEHIYTNYVWFANGAFWQSLSETDRSIISDAAETAIKEQRSLAARQNEEILADLERNGMEINWVDNAVRSRMKEVMNGAVRESLRQQTGSTLFDNVLLEVDRLGSP